MRFVKRCDIHAWGEWRFESRRRSCELLKVREREVVVCAEDGWILCLLLSKQNEEMEKTMHVFYFRLIRKTGGKNRFYALLSTVDGYSESTPLPPLPRVPHAP